MAYIELSDLNALLPEAYQIKALDDTRTGAADAAISAAVLDAASDEVDALLSPNYETPVTPTPTVCKQAALWIALDMIFIRRNVENATAKERADYWRDRIEAIGNGSMSLSATDSPVQSFDSFTPTYGVKPEDPDA
jgi:phage gp36-like protein